MKCKWDKGKFGIVLAGSDLVHKEAEKMYTIPYEPERVCKAPIRELYNIH